MNIPLPNPISSLNAKKNHLYRTYGFFQFIMSYKTLLNVFQNSLICIAFLYEVISISWKCNKIIQFVEII